ncbi:MAG: hypothetical protein DPW09_34625 [Anaerolineae bacterium]|nr:hypothetical protein [Anaerolineae bacterium]
MRKRSGAKPEEAEKVNFGVKCGGKAGGGKAGSGNRKNQVEGEAKPRQPKKQGRSQGISRWAGKKGKDLRPSVAERSEAAARKMKMDRTRPGQAGQPDAIPQPTAQKN